MCANYHINPETNRPNICKAQSVDSCPLRENSPHFANKEEAKVYVENKLSKINPIFSSRNKKTSVNIESTENNVSNDFTKKLFSLVDYEKEKPVTKKGLKALISRANNQIEKRKDFYTEDTFDEDTSLYVQIGSQGNEACLNIKDHKTIDFFKKGACIALAYKIAEKTDAPIAVFTNANGTENFWQGHVAVKIGDDKYLDIEGFSSRQDIKNEYGAVDYYEVSLGEDNRLLNNAKEALEEDTDFVDKEYLRIVAQKTINLGAEELKEEGS